MKVYHGSYMKIEEINLSKCQPRKDFGQGFYVTALRPQAEYWAKRMGEWKHTDGVVSEFDFKEYVVKDMKLNFLRFDGYTENWLDFIVLNRTNELERQAHDYDMVEGNVADDEVAARVFDYLNGWASKETLLKELEFKAPNHQLCFCTVQSLQALIPAKNDMDIKIIHIDNEILKSLVSEFHKNEKEAASIYYKSQTYAKLSDQTAKIYDKSWQEVYETLKQELNL